MRDLSKDLYHNMLKFEDDLEVYIYDSKEPHKPCMARDLRWLWVIANSIKEEL